MCQLVKQTQANSTQKIADFLLNQEINHIREQYADTFSLYEQEIKPIITHLITHSQNSITLLKQIDILAYVSGNDSKMTVWHEITRTVPLFTGRYIHLEALFAVSEIRNIFTADRPTKLLSKFLKNIEGVINHD
jgi:hypothetical protein